MTSHWKANLDPLLQPRSIAVVGASERGRGPRVIQSLRTIGYRGRIYPVNQKHREVLGLRCYSSILEIEGEIDCAAIQIPADGVLDAVRQCAQKEIKAIAINTAGFGGILTELLRDTSMRLCPLGERDAEEMLTELRGFRILTGYRGEAKRDSKATVDVLIHLSRLSVDLKPEVQSVDINPLMVLAEGEGVRAVDALVVLGPTGK